MTEDTNRLSVAIVDDEPLARLRLRSLVESCPEPRACVVGEAGDAGEAQRLLAATACDVVLLDIGMPGASGLRFADWLRHQPDPPAVVTNLNKGDKMLEKDLIEGRRHFLAKALPAGAIFCLGCKGMMASSAPLGRQEISGKKSKYLEDAGMTAEGVYKFAYSYFLPFLENMGNSLGREKILDLIEKAGAEIYAQLSPILAKDLPNRDPKSLAKLIGDFMTGASIYRQAFTFEITELTDKVYEATYSQCLPAKVFSEMNAADFDYAFECSPSRTLAKAFNPK